jgi:hypothetical protein
MNRRTAEQGTAECRSEKHCPIFLKTSAVRYSLFDLPAMRARRGGRVFDIQNKVKNMVPENLAWSCPKGDGSRLKEQGTRQKQSKKTYPLPMPYALRLTPYALNLFGWQNH